MGEKNTWNKLAAMYEDKFMSLEFYNSSYQKYCSLLPENSKILEVGCGPGIITKQIAETRPDVQILATDYASSMIELAKKNVPEASFHELDARQINTLGSTFNGVVAGFILPNFSKEETRSFVENCTHLLEEKGLIYFSFVEGKEEDSYAQKGSSGDELFFHYFERAFINELLIANGFALIAEFQINYPRKETEIEIHTALVVQKQL